MPEEFENAERGFWKELFGGMPDDNRIMVEKLIELVQVAHPGAMSFLDLCWTVSFFDNGKEGRRQSDCLEGTPGCLL